MLPRRARAYPPVTRRRRFGVSPEMDGKNDHRYRSGSFDGLSDAGGNHRHYFKSSFAKSMALETTKSLSFDLDLTGGNNDQQRFNTIGSPHRQVRKNIKRVVKRSDASVEGSPARIRVSIVFESLPRFRRRVPQISRCFVFIRRIVSRRDNISSTSFVLRF